MTSTARVQSLLQLGRHREAAAAAEEALASSPHDAALLMLLADARSAFAPQTAVAPARQSVALRPDDPIAMRVLARTEWRAGNLGFALDATDSLRTMAPDMVEGHSFRAGILAQTAETMRGKRRRARLQEARDCARHAIELMPTFPAAHLVLGQVELADGNEAAAAAAARNALALDPDHSMGHELLGLVAQKQGRVADAGDHYLAMGRADPEGDATDRLRKLSLPRTGAFFVIVYVALRIVSAAFRANPVGGAIAGVLIGGAFVLWWLGRRAAVTSRLSQDALEARSTANRLRWSQMLFWRRPR